MPLHHFHRLHSLIRVFWRPSTLNLKFFRGATECLLLVVIYRSPSSNEGDDLAPLEFFGEAGRDPLITYFLIVSDSNAPPIDWYSFASTDHNFRNQIHSFVFPSSTGPSTLPGLLDLECDETLPNLT